MGELSVAGIVRGCPRHPGSVQIGGAARVFGQFPIRGAPKNMRHCIVAVGLKLRQLALSKIKYSL